MPETREQTLEIERNFLVAELPPDLDRHPAERIQQGYLAVGSGDEPEVRLRRRSDQTLLTVKSAGTLVRVEEEIGLDERTFASLWPLTEGRRIEKVRHVIPHGDLTIELDIYEGDLGGLCVAEVEFPSEDASHRFEPPSWLGDEVTEDGRYKAKRLAVDGAP